MSRSGVPISAAFGYDPAAPSFYDALLADPEAFGLSSGFDDTFDDRTEDEDDAPGEQHNAHVVTFRAHREREEHVAALHGGVATIWEHLDGSPGCTTLGCDPEALHVRHTWADEADILAAPYDPAEASLFPTATGYPHCSLPWTWWPPVVKGKRSALLFIFRIWRAHRMVTAQIAASGGLDDDRGWITRPAMPDLAGLAEWRRGLFLPPSQRATAPQGKIAAVRRERRAASQSESGHKEPRPITVEGDRALVPLTRGYVAAIRAVDVAQVEGHDWHIVIPAKGVPFAMRFQKLPSGRKRSIRMHRIEGLTGPVEIIPPGHSQVS